MQALVVEQAMDRPNYVFDINDTAQDDWEFEPLLPPHQRPTSSEQDTASLGSVAALGQAVTGPATDDWCLCGQCDVTNASLPYRERTWCRSSEKANKLRLSGNPSCLAQPEEAEECVCRSLRFIFNVLDEWKLKADMWLWRYTFHYDEVDPPTGPSNKKLRYIAYRQYVHTTHGRLGDAIRVILPSCVVRRIRQEWPAPEGQAYEGYKDYSTVILMLDSASPSGQGN